MDFSPNQTKLRMKTSLKVLAMFTGLSALASFSYGNPVLTLSQDTTNFSVGNGGAFIVTNTTGPISISDYSVLAQGDGGFLTFCIEENEYFNPGGQYNYALSFGAKNGGVSGATNGYDPISNATAWLYSQFAQGILTVGGFSYSHANLGDLQNAIWFLEGEGGVNNYLSTYALNNVVDATGNSNGSYGVQAINLYYTTGENSQDQLYYHRVPDQGATLGLLGLGLLGLVGIRRKFARAK